MTRSVNTFTINIDAVIPGTFWRRKLLPRYFQQMADNAAKSLVQSMEKLVQVPRGGVSDWRLKNFAAGEEAAGLEQQGVKGPSPRD